MKEIRIPVSWVEYKKGEIVVQVSDDVTEKDIRERIEKEGVDNFVFATSDYPVSLVENEDATEYDNYEMY
jgi:predicted TIM-barrel fold metal-dependent hydrolase